MAARDRHNKNCRYDKEVPCVIKRQRRSERQKARISLKKGEEDKIERFRSTQGWCSW